MPSRARLFIPQRRTWRWCRTVRASMVSCLCQLVQEKYTHEQIPPLLSRSLSLSLSQLASLMCKKPSLWSERVWKWEGVGVPDRKPMSPYMVRPPLRFNPLIRQDQRKCQVRNELEWPEGMQMCRITCFYRDEEKCKCLFTIYRKNLITANS